MIEDILKWNETDTETVFNDSLQKIMHNTALKFSERTAITDKNRSISYGELDNLSNAVCNFLLEKCGNNSDSHICVYCCNCIEKICYITGIFKAGMTYVPLDVNLPFQRNHTIAENAETSVILADKDNFEKAKLFSENVCAFTIDELAEMDSSYTEIVKENRTAYIIYTSGSTGIPKGVCIPENSLLNFCSSIINLTGITENDRTCTIQNPAFDLSIMDMIPFLLVGSALYCIPDEIKKDISLVNKYMISNRITVQSMSTALYHLFLEEDNDILEKVFVIGEKMLKYRKKPYTIYNMYGPTEATVLVTYGEITEQRDNIPIGLPIANTKIIIVKEDGTMADVDEQGEICIMGKNLSSGYLNNEAETEKRFVPSVINPNEIMYKTGDTGMWTSDGELLCFGRMDFQIKHRGYRIELDEIRYHILELNYIDDCALIYNDRAENGYIVCFYCSANVEDISAERFINDLEGTLPEYMIPSRWIKTEAIPLNNNGKTDRTKLFEMLDATKNTHSGNVRCNDITATMRKIWAEALDIEENFNGNENFRTLGGHSILSMIIIRDIKENLNIDINFREFIECENFNEFVKLALTKSDEKTSDNNLSSNSADRYKPFVLNSLQTAYVVGRNRDMTLGGIPTHMYYEVTCDDFELQKLMKVFNKIFKAHDMLRIRIDDTGIQNIVPYYEITPEKIGFTDISGLDEEQKKTKLNEIRHNLETFIPDMKNGSLIKAVPVKTGEKTAVICAYFDSVIIDGWSAEELITELNTLYASPDSEIKTSKQTFRDYNNIIEKEKNSPEHERDKEYWKSLLPDLTATPCIPLKTSPKSVNFPHTRRIERSVTEEKWQNFEAICAKNKISTVAALYAVIGNVIARFSLNDSFTINLPIQKRFMNNASFNELIGNYSSYLLFSYKENVNDSWLEIFRHSSDQLTERLSHDSFHGLEINELIRTAVGKTENTSRIMFTSVPDLSRGNDRLWHKSYAETRTSQVWLDIISVTYDSKINFIWCYVTELFSDETAEAMADMFISIINRLCQNAENLNSTPISFYQNKPKYLPVSVDTPFARDFSALFDNNSFILKDRNGTISPVGAIGKIYTENGSATDFDGIYEADKIRLLGRTENRLAIYETVIYSDCIEAYAKKHHDVGETALVYDEKNQKLYLFYTAERNILPDEFFNISDNIGISPESIVYRKTEKIYKRSDGRIDKKRLLKCLSKGFASMFS